ncbi:MULTISPECIES: DNA adenine methylase [Xanthomonas]|uniref:DNA adenine methylase n=1 Tax=Xanthomonas TaxID=338 RepID=UPI0014831B28|nr:MULTISPECIES: DNA adenine methylase [Xanthomonas]MCC8726249.1 DNA adenine methylase [Xanthomonas euvesicatoria pv. euvesicatoria]MCC8743191.1 DNA adenine methylase [Xanthomonas euvesicatoria pv. euvesicatoria]MCC8747453.1 DNA adenine methylase [Xanthomonas euvesicatoria pv. euvesicatoria]MCC8755828.1 DNA adenine methylase [Xanthomonas euvesicatoria pv. euvesicatoria]MDC9642605.1 DNA adenine methylase [Xanthomonas euvesicatoria]
MPTQVALIAVKKMNEAISRSFSLQDEEAGLPTIEDAELAVAVNSSPPQKPFLRWAGGKTRLLSAILPHVPTSFRNFHEPFLGSGAMFFAVRARAHRCYLSDLNSELINVWQVVQTKPRALFNRLQPYLDRQGEDEYYAIRAEEPTRSLERAARFFYLNQTSWNGLWRENRWGVFNVPWGARAFRGIDFLSLKAVADTLKDTEIVEQDFRQSVNRAQPGDFVYLDPPYLPISDTSKFAGYNGKRFRTADLEELAFLCEGLTRRGVHWIVSNRDNEHIRKIFSHAKVYSFTTRRSVSAQAKRHIQPKDSPEVIVVGGPNR